MRAVVIGSGFGGLAAGIRLLAQGHEVTILERRDRAGGRASAFEKNGFVFDAGPTILTAPQFIDELFTLTGRRRQDHLEFVPIDPFYRVRFEDGSVFAQSASQDDVERQVAAFSPDDVPGHRRFMREARRIYDQAMPLIDEPMHSLGSALRVAPALARTRAWRSVASLAARCVRDGRLRRVLSFHPLLIGGNPFDTPSIYALVPELERRWGVWYPMGGMRALVRALVQLFEDAGGTLHLGCDVEELEVDERGRRVTGVRLRGGDVAAADLVVSNADVVWSTTKLVPPRYRSWVDVHRMARYRHGMSVFVLYLGTDRKYHELGHHEILMRGRYEGLLDDIFRRRRLADDFSLYIHHPTATDPSLAPAGCDAWYALVPVPHLGADIDWESAGQALRDRIIDYLEQRYLPSLSRHIVVEHRVDPRYFRDELNATHGGAFSLEPTLMQSAFFRPHNESQAVNGLYLAGAGTHPGAGIPGVLSSAKIAAKLVEARYGRLGQSAMPTPRVAASHGKVAEVAPLLGESAIHSDL